MPLNPTTKTVQSVADFVKRTFGDEAGVQITDVDIIRWINMGQMEILLTNPAVKAKASLDYTMGVSEYSLGALNVLKIQAIFVDGLPIEHKSFQEAQEWIISQDPNKVVRGTPVLWYEWAGLINLYPVPSTSSSGGIGIYFYPAPTPVVQTSDLLSIPDTYFNRICEYVLAQAYELDEDSQNSQFKLSQFNEGLGSQLGDDAEPETNTYHTINFSYEDEY